MNRKERKLKHIMIRKWCEGMVLMYQIHQWRNDTAGDVGIVYLKGKVTREYSRRKGALYRATTECIDMEHISNL